MVCVTTYQERNVFQAWPSEEEITWKTLSVGG